MALPVPANWWLDTIGRVPLLTPAEEIELGTAIQRWQQHPPPCPPGIRRRGMRARDRFVTANLRLAVSYVARRCNRLAKAHGGSEDLVQAANMGLITAAERFDPARGYRFSTYAYWWIRQAVNRWVDQHSRMVSIPGSHCQHLAKVSAITRRIEREQGRLPTHQELATELGVSLRVLEQVLENGRPIGSLDQIVTDGLELGATCASWDRSLEDEESQAERWRQAEQLRGLIARLPASDQQLLMQAWGLDGVEVPRAELARQEGISTRVLETRLERLQSALASQSMQLVLVAVARVPAPPRSRIRRRPRARRVEQLVLATGTTR
jgi:RNA polymerase primary sigma factor